MGRRHIFMTPDAGRSGVFYRFSTLQSVNISNISMVFIAENYDTKYFRLDYNIEQVLGFKIFYDLELLNKYGDTVQTWKHEELLAQNIITEKATYDKNMRENLYCRPGNGVFELGETYRINITLVSNGGLEDRENTENHLGWSSYEFTVKDHLLNPLFGTTCTASVNAEGKHCLNFRILPIDTDKVLVDDLYIVRLYNSAGGRILLLRKLQRRLMIPARLKNIMFTDLAKLSNYTLKIFAVRI